MKFSKEQLEQMDDVVGWAVVRLAGGFILGYILARILLG